ncbi:hypothetical protein [Ferrovum myxofaciens]|uniref:hypothetical protein n=1 Tax=Ferrovum myxofaciens TaxID=416213 RepID=UPI003EBA9156
MDFEKTENGLSISVGASGSEYMNQSPVKCCIELNKKQFEVIVAAAKDCLEKNYSMVRSKPPHV